MRIGREHLSSGLMEESAVKVVQVAVFHLSPVQVILGHCDLHMTPSGAIQSICALRKREFLGHSHRKGHSWLKRTSGPLNTLGSFMSFQTYRFGVDPLYLDKENCCAHQDRTSGLSMSR